ncbi:MAG: dockerin type I domain-containing protein [Candidatus Bathyarchaeia archaeon]
MGTEQVSLNATDQTTLTFTWNTTDFAYGNYTISAYAQPVPGETDTANNNFTGGVVTVTIPGDLNGDFKVNHVDLIMLADAYGSKPGDAKWNTNADLNGNSRVDLADLVALATHYGQHYP